jgi:hypothetical protein
MSKSLYEDILYQEIQDAGLPIPTRQFKAVLGRQFEWDFAWEEQRILLEVQGGIWAKEKTGHSTGAGIRRDCNKLDLALLFGWIPYQVTTDLVVDGRALKLLEMIFGKRDKNDGVLLLKDIRRRSIK